MKKMEIERVFEGIVKTCYNLEIINKQAKANPKALVDTSEKIYKNQIVSICNNIEYGKKTIVLIAGPSSSGKTTSAHKIGEELKKRGYTSTSLSLDNFYIDRAVTPKLPDGKYDFENITALDTKCIGKCLHEIATKKKTSVPEFDFVTGCRKKEWLDITLGDKGILIIEGTHALNPVLIKNPTNSIYKVYACVNSNYELGSEVVIPAKKLRLMRRMIRDIQTRGYSIAETVSNWNNVLRGEDLYIKPYKVYADYLLDTTHMYEPLLYDHYLQPLLKPEANIKQAKELLDMFQKCGTLKKDVVPKNSMLWEFLVK